MAYENSEPTRTVAPTDYEKKLNEIKQQAYIAKATQQVWKIRAEFILSAIGIGSLVIIILFLIALGFRAF